VAGSAVVGNAQGDEIDLFELQQVAIVLESVRNPALVGEAFGLAGVGEATATTSGVGDEFDAAVWRSR